MNRNYRLMPYPLAKRGALYTSASGQLWIGQPDGRLRFISSPNPEADAHFADVEWYFDIIYNDSYTGPLTETHFVIQEEPW